MKFSSMRVVHGRSTVSVPARTLHAQLETRSAIAQNPPVVSPELLEASYLADAYLHEAHIALHATSTWGHTVHTERGVPLPIAARIHSVNSFVSDAQVDESDIRCPFERCNGRTFGRLYDYERHFNGAHAENPTVYWCDVVGCGRSRAEGGRPFHRKDKRNDHTRKVHRI